MENLPKIYRKRFIFVTFAGKLVNMTIDICPSPALYPFYKKKNDTIIVTDVFRASATICAMLNNGASSVIPVASLDEAQKYKSEGFLVGGERNARKCDFADFGNSPFDYTCERVADKDVVFTTTNGTQAIETALGCENLFIGTFANIDALVERCAGASDRLVVLCAGWNNRINIEDMLFGGAFAEKFTYKAKSSFGSDSVRIALELWHAAKNNPLEYVKNTDHYRRLFANGAEDDAAFCLRENTLPVVPRYNEEDGKLRVV